MLIEEAGGQPELASIVKTDPNYISQLKTSRQGIARKFCVRLEAAMRKPDGWMDQWLPEEMDPAHMRKVLDDIVGRYDKPEYAVHETVPKKPPEYRLGKLTTE